MATLWKVGKPFWRVDYDYKEKTWKMSEHFIQEGSFCRFVDENGKSFSQYDKDVYINKKKAREALIKRNNKNVRKMEEISDGYHTFSELYCHRAYLFMVLVQIFPKYAWKSKLHSDGTMFDDMFIVGLDIPKIGQMSYHFDLKYYDLFRCKELERGLEWDGHTPEDVLKRLKSLSQMVELLEKEVEFPFI